MRSLDLASFIDCDGDMFASAEWNSRVDAAAGNRLLDLYGLTDMVEGVLGVRVDGEPDAYLLKTYRTFFDEVRASELVKVRFDEQPDAVWGPNIVSWLVRRRFGIR